MVRTSVPKNLPCGCLVGSSIRSKFLCNERRQARWLRQVSSRSVTCHGHVTTSPCYSYTLCLGGNARPITQDAPTNRVHCSLWKENHGYVWRGTRQRSFQPFGVAAAFSRNAKYCLKNAYSVPLLLCRFRNV